MSTDEFWDYDPNLFWAYRFSFYNKTKREQEQLNYNAWLQGAYIYEAVSVALVNGFSKTKANYSSKPYELKPKKKTKKQITNETVTELKARVAQVQAIFKEKNKG